MQVLDSLLDMLLPPFKARGEGFKRCSPKPEGMIRPHARAALKGGWTGNWNTCGALRLVGSWILQLSSLGGSCLSPWNSSNCFSSLILYIYLSYPFYALFCRAFGWWWWDFFFFFVLSLSSVLLHFFSVQCSLLCFL